MPVPASISDLSQTAGSNSPAGSESPTTTDDYFRAFASFIAQLRDGKGFSDPVTLASATTTDIGAQNSQFVEITGTTTITGFGTAYNGPRFLRFTGALILTHNATTLNLPGAANITTVAGDTAIAIPNSGGNGWNVVNYQLASATPGVTVEPDVQNFRLSLTTGVPVTTSDVTGATTIYAVPFTGKQISLFDGTNWNIRSSAQFSLALGTLTNALPYDVFCYDNAGVPTLEFTAWTNTTTRATALAYQDGILCKSGALTRRYLGTFYTTSTTTTADAAASTSGRYLFNYYHRKPRSLLLQIATANWTYTTATWRQANGSTANQVNWLCGVVEDAVEVNGSHTGVPTNAAATAAAIGLNSTTAPTGIYASGKTNSSSSIPGYLFTPTLKALPALGLNKACLLEWAEAIDTTSWYGVANTSSQQIQSGLTGEVMA